MMIVVTVGSYISSHAIAVVLGGVGGMALLTYIRNPKKKSG